MTLFIGIQIIVHKFNYGCVHSVIGKESKKIILHYLDRKKHVPDSSNIIGYNTLEKAVMEFFQQTWMIV